MRAVLPVVDRELRVAARRGGVWRTRLLGASAGLLILGGFLGLEDFQSSADFSKAFFWTLSGLAYALAALGGFAMTSDSLSEEKREGTLGLLFLTDLRNFDIVLGKVAANSLGVLYGLLALVPFLSISILSGGVGLWDFTRVVITALNLLFLSLSVGMFCSVFYREASRSLAASAVLMASVIIGIPLLCFLAEEWLNWTDFSQRTSFLWPGASVVGSFDTGIFRGSGGPDGNAAYAIASASMHFFAWGFLLTAIFRVGRSWQDGIVGKREPWWIRWLTGRASTQAGFRSALLDINPYFWRSARPRMRPALVWLLVGGVLLIYGWGLMRHTRWFLDSGTVFLLCILLHTLLKLWLLLETPRILIADRVGGAMELLLVTPMTPARILSGQIRGLVRMFGPPVAFVCLLDVLVLAFWREWTNPSIEEQWMLAAALVVFVADVVALPAVALTLGASVSNENRVVLMTAAWVLVIPWFLFWMGGILMAVWALNFLKSTPDLWDQWPTAAWVLVCLIVDAAGIAFACSRLPAAIRKSAVQRYDRTPKSG